jgi:hypothetical protein
VTGDDGVWLLATGAEIIAAYACRGPATTAAASATATHTRTIDRNRPIPPSNLPLARSSYEQGSPERSGAEQGTVALASGGDPAGAERSSAGMAGGVEGSVITGELVFSPSCSSLASPDQEWERWSMCAHVTFRLKSFRAEGTLF